MKQQDCDGLVGGVVVQARLNMVGLYRRDDEHGLPRRVLYEGRKQDVSLLYVTDHISGCCYVDVSGSDFETLIPVIQRRLDVWSDEELVESWNAADEEKEKMRVVLRLGLASIGKYAERWDTHTREALKAASEPVRFASVTAIGSVSGNHSTRSCLCWLSWMSRRESATVQH